MECETAARQSAVYSGYWGASAGRCGVGSGYLLHEMMLGDPAGHLEDVVLEGHLEWGHLADEMLRLYARATGIQ